jgi:hypothetical protein
VRVEAIALRLGRIGAALRRAQLLLQQRRITHRCRIAWLRRGYQGGAALEDHEPLEGRAKKRFRVGCRRLLSFRRRLEDGV